MVAALVCVAVVLGIYPADRKLAAGVPLAIHNIGAGTQKEDVLFAYPLTGHYRICFPSQQKKICR